LLHNAKLKQQAALEDIDYKHPRGLNKQLLLELSCENWLSHHQNVLLTGPTGVGKKLYCLRARQLRRPLGTHGAVSAGPAPV
jgi:DNA replication protein DnaC